MKLSKTTQFLLAASLVPAFITVGNFSRAQEVVKAPPSIVAQASSTIKSGSFVKGEAPTTGKAKIVKVNGQMFLEIDAAFSTTDQAPDLHVVLDPDANPPKTYTNQTRFLNLGKLQKVTGAQRYPIPSFVNVANFKSVVIWCRMANANIGFASLK